MKRGSLFLGIVLAWGLPLSGWGAPSPEKSAQSKQALHALRNQIQTLQKELAKKEESRQEASDALRTAEAAISKTSLALEELSRQQQDSREKLAKTENDLLVLKRQISGSQSRIGVLLKQQYISGQHDALRLVLTQRDPNQTARNLHYYSYLSQAERQAVQHLNAQMAQLARLAGKLETEHSELNVLASNQAQEKARLESEQKNRQVLLSRLSHQIAFQRNQLAKLQADERRLTRLVEEINRLIDLRRTAETKRRKVQRETARQQEDEERRKAAKAGKPLPPALKVDQDADEEEAYSAAQFTQLKGRLRKPLAGSIVGKFGSKRVEGTTWRGWFIQSPAGMAVRAVAKGQVVFSDWLRGFGNILIVDHGGGYMSLYGSAESLRKRVGDRISAGELIALTGNSGGSEHTGLYFELRHQGKPLDPANWVQ